MVIVVLGLVFCYTDIYIVLYMVRSGGGGSGIVVL